MWRCLVLALASLAAFASPASANTVSCMPSSEVAAVKANPDYVNDLYEACREEFADRLRDASISFSKNELRGAFAAALAHRFAPYGQSWAESYAELREEAYMHCGSYAKLTLYLYEDLGGDPKAIRMHGFDGAWPPGNHAQVGVDDLLLDPTIGYVADVAYEEARAGETPSVTLDFSIADYVPGFQAKVLEALNQGLYPNATIVYNWTPKEWYETLETIAPGLGREGVRADRPASRPVPGVGFTTRRALALAALIVLLAGALLLLRRRFMSPGRPGAPRQVPELEP